MFECGVIGCDKKYTRKSWLKQHYSRFYLTVPLPPELRGFENTWHGVQAPSTSVQPTGQSSSRAPSAAADFPQIGIVGTVARRRRRPSREESDAPGPNEDPQPQPKRHR